MTASVPPSGRVARAAERRAGQRRADARRWLGGIRLSGFMVIMLGLVVLAAFVLMPTLGTYLEQRHQIDALTQQIQLTRDEVAALEQERQRWSDPAYITTQARERLYYVRPGETVYLIDNDLPPEAIPREQGEVSSEIQQAHTDWMSQLVASLTAAGLAQTATSAQLGVPDPAVTPDGAATPAP